MRLRDLDAQFVYDARKGGYRTRSTATFVEKMQGVLFQCPKCAAGKRRGKKNGRGYVEGAHYILVYFAKPRGVGVAPPEVDKNPRWTMSGSSIDDLTLSPSINLDLPGPEHDGCRWHGWVKNGDAA